MQLMFILLFSWICDSYSKFHQAISIQKFMLQILGRWCKMVQDGVRWCKMVQYHAALDDPGRLLHQYQQPTSTCRPPRDPTDPCASVDAAEPIDPNWCLRPLQRARERRAARLKEGGHADVEFRNELMVNRDPRSWKPPAGACFVCYEVAADGDCHYWDEDIPICKPCIDKTEYDPSFHQLCINKFAARLNSQ